MENTNYTIRPAKESDFEEVSKLYHELYEMHFKALPRYYKEIPEHVVKRGSFITFLEDDEECVFVAEKNDRIIGFIDACIEEGNGGSVNKPYKRVNIEDLVVTESERNKNVGTELSEQVELWAKERDIDTLTVIVCDFDGSAIDFYKKQDFSPYTIRMNKTI